MFATTQGYGPGAPVAIDDNSSTDSAELLAMAEATPEATAPGVPLPEPSPNAADASARMPAPAQSDFAAGQPVVMANTAVDALNRGITQSQSAQPISNLYGAAPAAPAAAAVPAGIETQATQATQQPVTNEAASADTQAALQAEARPQVQELAVVAPPKRKSIFARMFAPQNQSKKNAPSGTKKRLVSAKAAPVTVSAVASLGNALPGVNVPSQFGDNSSTGSGEIQLASAAGLARLAPNGLHLQTERVEVDCFKPQLVRTLKNIERHYGRPVVVTSGYRSPKHNRRIGGASGSRHTSCEAADIQVEGVSKWQLAKYLRSIPNRGGVGTYCHTESVHIDIGNTRDWNWRCRRRK